MALVDKKVKKIKSILLLNLIVLQLYVISKYSAKSNDNNQLCQVSLHIASLNGLGTIALALTGLLRHWA